MKRYTHLTSEQRYQISNGLKEGYSQQTIADIIGVNKSTISREIRRNGAEQARVVHLRLNHRRVNTVLFQRTQLQSPHVSCCRCGNNIVRYSFGWFLVNNLHHQTMSSGISPGNQPTAVNGGRLDATVPHL